jgi:trigger factor
MTTISSFQDVSPTHKTLTFEIPVEEVEREAVKAARQLSKTIQLPGFRPGKAPLDMIRKRFAREMHQEVVEHLIEHAVLDAMKEKHLDPIGEPKVSDVVAEDGKPLTFKLDVEVRPEVNPKDYRGLKVPAETAEVTQEDIEKALTELRQRNATYEPVEDRPVADGDFVLVDIKGTYPEGDGKDFEHDKVLVEIGAEQTMPEITANLRNAEPGMHLTFQKSFAEDEGNAEFSGKTVLYTVVLHAIKKMVLPELDDELARTILSPREGEPLEGATVEMLKTRLSESMLREKQNVMRRKKERALLDGLLALNEVDAPESMIHSQIDSTLREYARMISREGVDLEKANINWQELRDQARPGAERKVKEYLLLDAIASLEKIEVTETEVDAELKGQAAMVGAKWTELKASYRKAERLGEIFEELRLRKVMEFLLSEAITPPQP